MAGTLNFGRHRVLYFLLIINSVVPHKENYSSFKRTTSRTDISNGFEQSRRVDLLDFLRGWEGIQVKLTRRFWRTNRAVCKTSKRGSTCLAIPGHDPPLDITIFHDIPKNPGPTFPQGWNFSAIRNNEPGSNLHISSEGCAPMITYSREQLLHLRSSSNAPVCTRLTSNRVIFIEL